MRISFRFMSMAFALMSGAAYADSFFVSDTAGVGVFDNDLKAMTELVRSSLTRSGKHQITAKGETADYTLRPKLIRIGNAYLAGLEKNKNEKTIYTSQLKIGRLDELDTAVTRLVRSTVEEIPVENTLEIDQAVGSETTRGSGRRQALPQYYLGFGPALTAGLGDPGLLLGFQGAYAWDLNPNALRIFLDAAFSNNEVSADFVVLGIGLQHFFSSTDITPFIAADFGYGSADSEVTERTNGFAVAVQGGYQFFRTSNVALEVAGRYSLLLESNEIGLPQIFSLRVGLYFHF